MFPTPVDFMLAGAAHSSTVTKKQWRALKRAEKAKAYAKNGLNGPAAVARRARQRLRREQSETL